MIACFRKRQQIECVCGAWHECEITVLCSLMVESFVDMCGGTLAHVFWGNSRVSQNVFDDIARLLTRTSGSLKWGEFVDMATNVRINPKKCVSYCMSEANPSDKQQSAVDRNMTAAGKQYDELKTRHGEAEAETDKRRKLFVSLKSDLAGLQTKLEQDARKMKALESERVRLENKVNNYDADDNILESRKNDLNKLKTEISALAPGPVPQNKKAEFSKLETEVRNMEKRQKEIKEDKSKILRIDDEIAALKTSIAVTESNIQEKTTDMDDAKNNLASAGLVLDSVVLERNAKKSEYDRYKQQSDAVKAIGQEKFPIQYTKKTVYNVQGGNFGIKDTFGRVVWGTSMVFLTFILNIVLYVPALLVFKSYGAQGFNTMYWIPFCICYALPIVILLVMYIGYTKEGNIDPFLAGWCKTFCIFLVISAVFGVLMYFISKSITADMQNEEKAHTNADFSKVPPVSFTIIGYVSAYVIILQLLSLILLFGFSPKINGGIDFNGLAQTGKKFLGMNKDVEAKMQQLRDAVERYNGSINATVLINRIDTNTSNFSKLAVDLVNLARDNLLPGTDPNKVGEFGASVVAILFGVTLTPSGMQKTDNVAHSTKLAGMKQAINSIAGDVEKVKPAELCNGPSIDSNIDKFTTIYNSIYKVEHDALALLGLMTPNDLYYTNVGEVIEKTQLLSKMLTDKLEGFKNCRVQAPNQPTSSNSSQISSIPSNTANPSPGSMSSDGSGSIRGTNSSLNSSTQGVPSHHSSTPVSSSNSSSSSDTDQNRGLLNTIPMGHDDPSSTPDQPPSSTPDQPISMISGSPVEQPN